MQIKRRRLRNYSKVDGNEPFREWIRQLRDKKAQAIIAQRIERLRLGNLGDSKRIDKGLYELRIHYGPGYRVYYTIFQDSIVILLCGGFKKTQQQDIGRAQNFCEDFLKRINGE